MVEAAQARAARALIGWSQAKLAETAGVPASTINEFETGSPDPIANEAADKIRAALEAGGVVFIPKNGGGGIGVRLREALEGEYIGWNDLDAPSLSRRSPVLPCDVTLAARPPRSRQTAPGGARSSRNRLRPRRSSRLERSAPPCCGSFVRGRYGRHTSHRRDRRWGRRR
jgi:transcriptional regulator with XRE-family HTH domain